MYLLGKLYAVLDIDSPVLNRFTAADQTGLELLAASLKGLPEELVPSGSPC